MILDEDALKKVLEDPVIQDKNIMILSMAGAFRKGKSFMLSLFLRYLRERGVIPRYSFCIYYPQISGYKLSFPQYKNPDLMKVFGEKPINDGFHWRGGTDAATIGVLLWDQPFILKKDDEEVATYRSNEYGFFSGHVQVHNLQF